MKLKLSKKDIKANRGITLIALVITIIVLLILAGVAIATLTGDNGLLTKAGDARNTTQDAEIEEEIRVAWNKVYMDSYLDSTTDKANALKTELEKNKPGETATVNTNGSKLNVSYRGKDKVLDVSTGTVSEPLTVAKAKSAGTVFSDDNTPLPDKDGNIVVIPKGFKISSDSAEVVTEGIVIEDATYTNTIGSEFVWIPVSKDSTDANKVKGAKGNKTITLSRYTFDENGTSNDQGANTIDNYFTELSNSSYRNAVAKTDVKSANGFIAKTNAAGGFWIGRYEARTTSSTARSSHTNPLTADTDSSTSNNLSNSNEKVFIKVYVEKGKLVRTEFSTSNDDGKFVIVKTDNGARFEIVSNNANTSSSYNASIQKIKTNNDLKYNFTVANNNQQLFDLIVTYAGINTNQVHEISELNFEFDTDSSILGSTPIPNVNTPSNEQTPNNSNVTTTSSKIKFVSTYNNTKSLGATFEKNDVKNEDIMLINSAPNAQSIQSAFAQIGQQFVNVNNSKLASIGLNSSTNPFLFYIPSVVPVGASMIIPSYTNNY